MSTPLNSIDPYTQVHQAIWDALTSNQPWAAFFPLGARINAVPPGMQSVKVTATTPGSCPEVRIIPAGRAIKRINSLAYGCRRAHAIKLTTFNLNVTQMDMGEFLTDMALANAKLDLGLPDLVMGWDWTGLGRESQEDNTKSKIWVSTYAVNVDVQITGEMFQQLALVPPSQWNFK